MTHEFQNDPRNASVLVHVNGKLVPRADARISVFDSGFLMGDGVWEGLRVHRGRIPFLDRHLDRLEEGAKSIALDVGRSRDELIRLVRETLVANEMTEDGHLRVMLTRGEKTTPYQDPRVNVGPATLVITAEFKTPTTTPRGNGIRLFTVHVRRGRPDVQDPKWNSHSKLNCITACIQGGMAGADEALMLDPQGFVATCNSTNFFVVRDGEVWTATRKYIMPGITRAVTLELCRDHGIPWQETDFSLTDVYGADEAFTTGTFGGHVPVVNVDGRAIGNGKPGALTRRLMELYTERIAGEPEFGA